MLAGDLADLRARVEEARRGLVVDQRDDVRVVGDRVFDVRNREGLPPVGLDSSTRGVAVGDPGEPAAELPVDQRDDLTVLVNEVGDGRFHPHRRRAVENQRRAALGGGRLAGERRVLEDVVESVLCALVHRLELRGSVRHHRLRHRLEHLVGHRHGTGVEEQEVLAHSWGFRGVRDKRRGTLVRSSVDGSSRWVEGETGRDENASRDGDVARENWKRGGHRCAAKGLALPSRLVRSLRSLTRPARESLTRGAHSLPRADRPDVDHQAVRWA